MLGLGSVTGLYCCIAARPISSFPTNLRFVEFSISDPLDRSPEGNQSAQSQLRSRCFAFNGGSEAATHHELQVRSIKNHRDALLRRVSPRLLCKALSFVSLVSFAFFFVGIIHN